MIEHVSERISRFIYSHNDRNHVSQDVLKFALIGIFTNVSVIILTLCIGWLDGKFPETVLALVCMVAMRLTAGGYHIRSPLLCIIVSTFAVIIVPYISLPTALMYIFIAVSALLVLVFAPADLRKNTRISERSLRLMKYSALLIVLSNLFITSDILAIAILISSLTMISIKGGEKSHE